MKKTAVIVLLMAFSLVMGQEGKKKRADSDFQNYAFLDAIESYENLVEDGYSDEQIYKKLGNANYVNAQYESAAEWYGKLMALESSTVESDYIYRYAQSLKSTGDYEGSDKWMERFNAAKSQDQRAKNFLEKEDYLEQIKRNSDRYDLKNLAINSSVSDFAPSFYDKELVFSTARDSGVTSRNIHEWNNSSFLNLFSATVMEDGQFGEPKKLSRNLNTKTHESSSVFSKDGNVVYFTRNNSKDGRFARDVEGISRLKIFRAVRKDGVWEKAEELPFNGENYSVAHPALTEDEKTLYFSSDMPGTIGASDIFMVAINEDGSFGTPKNLGPSINTEARESFPFIEDDVLYFASDGHPGLGGLDVFATKLNNSNGEVLNLGEPLNSRQDDFSFIIENGKGYFASNREGGMGNDDIYSFTENEPLKFECISQLTGIVKDRESDMPLAGSKVIVMLGETIVTETMTNSDGSFGLDVDCNQENYSLVANKEGYLSHSESIVVERGQPTEVVLALPKAKAPRAVVGTDLIAYLQLNPIYFDLDKSNIRPDAEKTLEKVVAYLNEYPDVNISIESHTDVKASTSYNQKLSERRAKSTFDFLVGKGISASRMVSKGFGEKQLINDCTIWSNCSPEENERNRRSEIIVVELANK